MSNEIALWKDGIKVAVCGGYMAQPDQNGIYRLLVDAIYPTDAAFQNHIDIIQMQDFRLACQTATRCIQYCIHHWDGKLELTAEINGGIKQLVAFTSVRKEVAFG